MVMPGYTFQQLRDEFLGGTSSLPPRTGGSTKRSGSGDRAPSLKALRELLSEGQNSPETAPERKDIVAITAAFKVAAGEWVNGLYDEYVVWACKDWPGNDPDYIEHIWNSKLDEDRFFFWLCQRLGSDLAAQYDFADEAPGNGMPGCRGAEYNDRPVGLLPAVGPLC
jgi:hypothetical protein